MMSSRASVCRTRADPSSCPRAEEIVEDKTPAMMKGSAYATCCMMYLRGGMGKRRTEERGGEEEEKRRRRGGEEEEKRTHVRTHYFSLCHAGILHSKSNKYNKHIHKQGQAGWVSHNIIYPMSLTTISLHAVNESM